MSEPTSLAQNAARSTAEGILLGRVADNAENAPVRNAFVYIHGGRWLGDSTPSVDADGEFKAHLPAGLYDVFIASGGFAPTCAVVEVMPGGTASYEARLLPDNEHLQR